MLHQPHEQGNVDAGKSVQFVDDQQLITLLKKTKSLMTRVRDRIYEPIAIVGLGCRFPGARSPHEFWDLLDAGRSAIQSTPENRWPSSLAAEQPRQSGRVTANVGGFLERVDEFDPGFFGISDRETKTLDPQHRLVLEVAWETLEHAGVNPQHVRGDKVGVFIGICSNDFLYRTSNQPIESVDNYLGTGNAHSTAAGRLSYLMDWQGPSIAIDTACSSSLTAVHLATRSLRYGDCNSAIVAGVNLILAPELSVCLSQAGMLSPSGKCHSFGVQADGFVRGEGCGAVYLKRLSDAVRDQDQILCVINGTACNQDGRSNGLTAPSALSQERVIREALADARLKPHEVDYVEAHGTGTPLGDPIEIQALQSVFAEQRSAQAPLRVGSVKTNVGHLEGAAGICGLIKVALAMSNSQLPAHLNANRPSSQVDWEWPVELNASRSPWPSGDKPRVAGVSSFGFGGTNVHAIVSEPPKQATSSLTTTAGLHATDQRLALASVASAAPTSQLFVLSAKSISALQALAGQYVAAIANNNETLEDICATVGRGRAHFEHRIGWLVDSKSMLIERLKAFLGQPKPTSMELDAPLVPSLSWHFGDLALPSSSLSQLDAQATLPDSLDAGSLRQLTNEYLRQRADLLTSAHNFLAADSNETYALSQASIGGLMVAFAEQLASAQVWRDIVGSPREVSWTGLGRYAAACSAGVLEFDDAIRLIRVHGQRIAEKCEVAQGSTRAEIARLLRNVQFNKPVVNIHDSSLRNDCVTSESGWQSWLDSLPAGSADSNATKECTQTPPRSPASRDGSWLVISPWLSASPDAISAAELRDDHAKTSQQLLELYLAGIEVDWRRVQPAGFTRANLPTYAFQRRRFWFESNETDSTKQTPDPTANVEAGVITQSTDRRFLGEQIDLGGREIVFSTDLAQFAFLQDHRVGGAATFPASGYLELAWSTAEQLLSKENAHATSARVSRLRIRRPIVTALDDTCRINIIAVDSDTGYSCRLVRRDGHSWKEHASWQIVSNDSAKRDASSQTTPSTSQHLIPKRNGHTSPVSINEHYGRFETVGIDYANSFRSVRQLFGGTHEAWGVVSLATDVSLDHFIVHPALLDACLQVAAGANILHDKQAFLPIRIESASIFSLHARPAEVHVYAKVSTLDDENQLRLDYLVDSPAGEPLAAIENVTLQRTGPQLIRSLEAVGSRHTADAPEVARSVSAGQTVDREQLLDDLHRSVAEVLEMEPEQISVTAPLDRLGLDSMMAYELKEQLEEAYSINIPISVFLDDLTLNQFADLALDMIGKNAQRSDERPVQSTRTELNHVNQPESSGLDSTGHASSTETESEQQDEETNWIEGEL